MADGALPLLAVCEGTSGTDQILGVLFAIAIVGVWAGLTWLVAWLDRTRTERTGLSSVLVVSAIAASLVILSLHDDLEVLLFTAAIVVVAIGAGAALRFKRFEVLPAVGAALLGGALLPLAVLAIFIVHVSIGPGCVGEELG